MVSAFIWTSPSSMWARTTTLETDSGHNSTRWSALPLGLQRYVCPDWKMPPVVDAITNLLQTLSFVTIHSRFGKVGHKTFSLINDYFCTKVLISTRLMKHHIHYICCTDRQELLTECKGPLLKRAPLKLAVKNWNLWKITTADWLWTHQLWRRTNIQTLWVIRSLSGSMASNQLLQKFGSIWWPKICCLIHTNLKIFVYEKTLPWQIVIGYFTMSPAIYLAVTGTMTNGICEFLSSMMDKVTPHSIWS